MNIKRFLLSRLGSFESGFTLKQKVLELAFKGKIEPRDAILLILWAGRWEALIQKSPKPEDFELAFDRGLQGD
jgi:hypothetical protein